MRKQLRVAVIGGGMFFDDVIGQSLMDFQRGGFAGALTSIGMSHWAPRTADIRVRLAAVGTRSERSGTAGRIVARFRSEFPDSRVAAYYGERVHEEIIAREKPDLLFVATPDHLHAPAILHALRHGIHVITEKPLCLRTADADAIIDRAATGNLIVAVDMHKRYDPAVRELMTGCRAKYDRLNRVRAVLEEPLAVSTEIFQWAEHSNPFAYVGCHWLDVVAHYLDVFPASLFATGEKNLLTHWDEYVKILAEKRRQPLSAFSRHAPINTWDSLNVNVTYTDGMRGDFNNTWINPMEFEGAVNQEIEVYGVLGRGFVDQQDRGLREAVAGDGSRTRNPFFGGRIQNRQGHREIFGYGKASIVAGMLAVSRVMFFGEQAAQLAGSYPDAGSQRSVTMIIEAAGIVAERNSRYLKTRGTCPVTAAFTPDRITVIDPYRSPVEEVIYSRPRARRRIRITSSMSTTPSELTSARKTRSSL